MTERSDKRVELILRQLEQLPTLPAVALRVLEATGSDQTSAADVVRLIESDPAMTSRVLALVNRADLGVRGEVGRVDRAVVLLGFDAVRNAVLALGIFDTFSSLPRFSGSTFSREDFWKHCLAVACASELLAELTAGSGKRVDPSDAFVCGLLHDLGKLALDAALPKSFARVVEASELLRANFADIERDVIGIDHMVVGKRLCERWGLPAHIRDAVWLHGQDPRALPNTVQRPELVALVTLANELARSQHLGYSGNHAAGPPLSLLCESLGVHPSKLDGMLAALVQRIESRARALGLDRASSPDIYREALSRAHDELGKVTNQLAARNRKLAVRARFFEALAGFQAELRPDAPPGDVLQAIAQTAVSVLEVGSCCAFSLPPGRSWAEVVMVDHAGDVFDVSTVDYPDPGQERPGQLPAGDGPVCAAGEEMEWLIEQISPRLGHERRFWIQLVAEGQTIGGVVWGQEAGEAQRLGPQVQELSALRTGWSLALRTAQIREQSRALAEDLAEANRRLAGAQAELIRAKTLATVGEMAAGAAHEMNNPLAVISGRSQLLARELSDPKQQAAATLVYEQSQRLSAIITELMTYARPTAPNPVPLEPAELVDRALHEAKQRTEPADRAIEVTLRDVPAVLVDVAQVSAAVGEVIGNALQATDERTGRIGIHAAYESISGRVVLTIEDNGTGMDEATMKRAFDPFFSARPAGRRRGMGLAKALRWIESSGGTLRLESHPGQGTRVSISLPAANREQFSVAARKKA